MTDEQKKWIDQASYRQLLERWRYAPCGDPMFQGDTGVYYEKVMAEQRSLVGLAEHVSISKAIDRGWVTSHDPWPYSNKPVARAQGVKES